MPIKFFYIRFVKFFRKYGFAQSIKRLWIITKRRLFQQSSIIYYSNLIDLKPSLQSCLNLKIENKKNKEDLTDDDYKKLYKYHDERIINNLIKNRFDKGAVLCVAKLNDEFVGFIWTIKQYTVKPFYFPLLEQDVFLFDNEIFEDYRGKGINSVFVDKVLLELHSEKYTRAFIDTRLWNKSEIHCLDKTCFKKLAIASQVQLFGKNIVIWRDQKKLGNI